MTTLDRAFIKAFGESGSRAAARMSRKTRLAAISPSASDGEPEAQNTEITSEPMPAPFADIHWPPPEQSTAPEQKTSPERKPFGGRFAPLSAFTGSAGGVSASGGLSASSVPSGAGGSQESFQALLEIDHLNWPETSASLLVRAGDAWRAFGDVLVDRATSGQKSIAIASCERAVGRTSVALALAKHLAARRLRPLVVDADFANPSVARFCGIAARSGWGEILTSELPLGEALIASLGDHVTIMPWHAPGVAAAQLVAAPRVVASFEMLRDHFDLTIFDAPALVDERATRDFAMIAESIGLDAVYLVCDARGAHRETLAATSTALRRAGVAGLIENFFAPSMAGDSATITAELA